MKGKGKVIFTKLLGGVEELDAGTFRSYHGMFYCTCQNIHFYEFYLSRNAFKLRPSLIKFHPNPYWKFLTGNIRTSNPWTSKAGRED
jgi:hypothetical protein